MTDRPIFDVLDLTYLLNEFDEEKTLALLKTFRCERDADREDFLHNTAIMMEKKSISRTYLALSDGVILGYFSIGLKCMRAPAERPYNISNTFFNKMNIDRDTGVAQSYLLGQLGRDDRSPKGLGKYLIKESLMRLDQARRIVGCRVVRVDCIDELIAYYESNGFFRIGRNAKDDLNQMVILL